MNFELILKIISFITASLILLLGIIITTGFMLPPNIPSNFRVMLGVMMMMYGVYRVTMLWVKFRRSKNEVEE